MKVLVCGGRDYADAEKVQRALEVYLPIDQSAGLCVIQGGAAGADRLAREWAEANGVPVMEFPANWAFFGKAAGPIRNNAMLEYGQPDAVVAFPGGRGTAHMVRAARAQGVNVVEIAQ